MARTHLRVVPRVGIEELRAISPTTGWDCNGRFAAAYRRGTSPGTSTRGSTALNPEVARPVHARVAVAAAAGGSGARCGTVPDGGGLMSIETTTSAVLGPMSDVQLGEGRAYAVGDRQIAVFRLSDGTCAQPTPPARTTAAPSPTASPTSVSSCARCISTRSASPTAAATTSGIGSVRTYQIADQGGQIVVVIDPG